MVSKTCPVCGKEFGHNRSPSYLKNRTWCSPSCRQRAKTNPNKRAIFTCKWCGKQFEEWAYRNPTMCSRQCTVEYAARQPKPAQRRPENFVTVCCEQCGKDYVVHKCQVTLRNSKFCSVLCRNAYASLHMQGINHPRYKGGTDFPNRGSNWIAQRRKALQRDNRTCQRCGRVARKGEKRVVAVHHIIPYRKFEGDYLKANVLSNLITLCRKCHALVEHHGVACPQRLL